jgi:hypothetical protein
MAKWDRIAASSGIVAVVLLAVGFSSSGTNPSWTASGTSIAHDYASNRDSGLASVIIVGIGLMALIWFAATLASVLRASGEERLGFVVLAGAATFVSIFAIAGVVQWTLFYGSAGGDPALTKALFQMQSLAASLAFLPLALMVFAFAVATARSKILPAWSAAISGLAALFIVISVGTVAQSGFFSPNGGYIFIALLALAVWLVVTSILLMRAHGAVRQVEPATA